MPRDYKIFISHSCFYPEYIIKLHSLLEDRGYFNVVFQTLIQNEPFESKNSGYIKRLLKWEILHSDVVLAVLGDSDKNCDWMNWELEIAKKKLIPVVGVVPPGEKEVSDLVRKYSVMNVSWNTDEITKAIRLSLAD